MKIEINNVYQKKTISKTKLGILIGIFIVLVGIIIWRLYYERIQTTGVNSFANFIGLETIFKSKNNVNNLDSINEFSNELLSSENDNVITKYIPNITEQSLKNINNIYNLREDGQKLAYLTFDDGPSRDVTVMILDILKENSITGTFFVLGNKVEQNPDILKRIYNEGHYIANHGYSHIYSRIYMNNASVMEEYNQCENAIRNALEIPEYSTYLFRFPRWFCWWTI